MCVVADLPASRKIGGVLGHQALHGCKKCWKEFPRWWFGDRPNYAGYDRPSWITRTDAEHRQSDRKSCLAKTEAERSTAEQQFGGRNAELFRLEYYDCIRFLIIDPMHMYSVFRHCETHDRGVERKKFL